MTKIQIKRLSMENFKCHRHLELDLRGGNASVYGDNATGKSSIYDAFTWLLFAKDSHGNGEKNLDIKPLDQNGEVADHDCETVVEALLQVDGNDICLRRTLKEVWVTKRGSSEAVYDGNTSEYFVNGVPVKQQEFKARVDALVSEDMFRTLTSVSFFAETMPWQKRRELLFGMADIREDRELLHLEPRFAPLLEAMAGLSLPELRAKLTSQRKGLTVTRNELPARISECENTVSALAGIDFDKLREEESMLRIRRNALEEELFTIKNGSAIRDKEHQVRQAQLELDELAAANNIHRKQQQAAFPDLRDLDRKLTQESSELTRLGRQEQRLEASRQRNLDAIDACRSRWHVVNGETFQGGECPTCGQALPTQQRTALQSQWEAQRRSKLDRIEADAALQKELLAADEEALAAVREQISACQDRISDLTEQRLRAGEQAQEVTDLDSYAQDKAAATQRIDLLQKELFELRSDAEAAVLEKRKELGRLEVALAEKSESVAKQSLLDFSRQRIETLREDARRAAAELARLDGLLWLIEDFIRFKTSHIEEEVNGLFRFVRFRLFREQANGGLEERCDATVDGVPYQSLNSGMRINAGIDIINALSRANGVQVPLFIDNAESVTNLENTDTQVVRLVVSEKDKELRICHEN